MAFAGPSEIELLPGTLGPEAVGVQPVFDARRAIRSARRRATLQDLLDVLLLLAIDAVFLFWKTAHVPFLTRQDTLVLLAGIHILMFGCFLVVRKIPVWRARRISSTWCRAERARFNR